MLQISSGPAVLENRPESVSRTALNQLTALGVDVRLNTKVKNSAHLSNGKEELTLSGGDKLLVDLYIPTFGVIPNSSFVASEFLDPNGFIKVDEYFSVKGAEGVFAIGDVNNMEPPQILPAKSQSVHMAKNLILSLSNRPQVPYKASTKGTPCVVYTGEDYTLTFWDNTAKMGLQIGKKSGTGHVGDWKLPGFLVVKIRKTLFVEDLPKMVDGSML
jgi:NADH dehydrogenase FAD-containing subunit